MNDDFARAAAVQGDNDLIRAILQQVCDLTGMGFSAVARVTEARWVAVQVLDRIDFGLNPGDELEIKTTICDEIRQSGQYVVIDDVTGHPDWRMHHTPMLYGFESYASFPLFNRQGAFYGTLCAIDPKPRELSGAATINILAGLARQTESVLFATEGVAP